jgi:pilus assembly protein TadC
MHYFGLWSLGMLLVGAVLMLAHFTGTSLTLGFFFAGAGLVIGGIYLARRVARRLRQVDGDPRTRDRSWPGAKRFP